MWPERYDEIAGRENRAKLVPIELDKIADAVLNYRPKPKSKAAKKRRRNVEKKAKG